MLFYSYQISCSFFVPIFYLKLFPFSVHFCLSISKLINATSVSPLTTRTRASLSLMLIISNMKLSLWLKYPPFSFLLIRIARKRNRFFTCWVAQGFISLSLKTLGKRREAIKERTNPTLPHSSLLELLTQEWWGSAVCLKQGGFGAIKAWVDSGSWL